MLKSKKLTVTFDENQSEKIMIACDEIRKGNEQCKDSTLEQLIVSCTVARRDALIERDFGVYS